MNERILEQVSPARREFLKRILAGAAFATPIIATFTIEAVISAPVYGAANISCPKPPVLAPAPTPAVPACPPFSCAPPPVPVPATTPVVLACPTQGIENPPMTTPCGV